MSIVHLKELIVCVGFGSVLLIAFEFKSPLISL